MIEKEIIVSMNEDSKNTCNVKKRYSKITRNKKKNIYLALHVRTPL